MILLSATMHRSQRLDYISCFSDHPGTKDELSSAYPLITQVDREGNVHQHPVAGAFMHPSCRYQKLPLLNDIEGLARHVLKRTQHGGCFCVMMNTVKRAQAVYRALQNMGETCVMLFHAKYRMRRRMEIERMCLKLFGRGGERPKRMILVCTQVVEQSLDLDFDGMICDLAVHQPDRGDGGIPNPHFHVLVPIRPLNADGTWGFVKEEETEEESNIDTFPSQNEQKAACQ